MQGQSRGIARFSPAVDTSQACTSTEGRLQGACTRAFVRQLSPHRPSLRHLDSQHRPKTAAFRFRAADSSWRQTWYPVLLSVPDWKQARASTGGRHRLHPTTTCNRLNAGPMSTYLTSKFRRSEGNHWAAGCSAPVPFLASMARRRRSSFEIRQ